MGAAVMGGHDFHILVPVATIQLVFDAEVGEMDRLVEVGES